MLVFVNNVIYLHKLNNSFANKVQLYCSYIAKFSSKLNK